MNEKTSQLKKLLNSERLEFLMEAHNGLSARLVQEAGFPGIWASGLSISAAMGVRDSNEASWTQVLEVAEFMSDATSIPILLDGDTGYGNFNSVRRLVCKLEQRQIAGVCLEDKLFPKTNSFVRGARQPLAEVSEFVGKIQAAKDTHRDPDFCVVARTEAFIAGQGLAEALKRATAYAEAGADAIVMHSKSTSADEVLDFLEVWTHCCPVILIPTTYFGTPVEAFRRAGARVVIWANHLMRSAVAAMQQTAARIHAEQSVAGIQSEIASIEEVFRLLNVEELEKACATYLPSHLKCSTGTLPGLDAAIAGNRKDSPSVEFRSFTAHHSAVER